MADEYRIERLSDLLQVPQDRWSALLADLREWMQLRSDVKEAMGPLIEAGFMKLPEGMTWVDDGHVGLSELRVVVETQDGQGA